MFTALKIRVQLHADHGRLLENIFGLLDVNEFAVIQFVANGTMCGAYEITFSAPQKFDKDDWSDLDWSMISSIQ
jgi:hypothetical protein